MPKLKVIFPAGVIEGIGGANILKSKQFDETRLVATRRKYFLYEYSNIQRIKHSRDYSYLAWRKCSKNQR